MGIPCEEDFISFENLRKHIEIKSQQLNKDHKSMDNFKVPGIVSTKSKKSLEAEAVTLKLISETEEKNNSLEAESAETVADLNSSNSPNAEAEKPALLQPLPPPPKSKEQILAEKQKKYSEILAALKYNPPENGSSCADTKYSFEILKTGTIVGHFKFSRLDNKGFYVVGRVPACDIVAENPTVSRTHAILQFISCAKEGDGKVGNGESGIPNRSGLYIYDLNSTHGSFINKNQIFPNRYYRLNVGHVLKFGNSTRLYVLLGPSDDEEEENEKSVTELQNERLQRELQRKKLDEQGILIKTGEEGEGGCGWGMADDAVEEADQRENPFAINFEASESFDNPKKTLRGWFEREGFDLVYDCREKAPGQFICRINLPVDGPAGQPVFAEVDVKGKKKDAVHQAALQACQILDKYGVLRVSQQESKSKRKHRDWEDQDYYSSDEDTFLDRTGSVESKRDKRMKIAGKIENKVETYESLSEKAQSLQDETNSLQSQIIEAQNVNANEEVDIDDYVKFLKTGATDVKKLKSKLREVSEELKKVNKLLNIAKPANLPAHLLVKKEPNIKVEPTPQTDDIKLQKTFNKTSPSPDIKTNSKPNPKIESKTDPTLTPTLSNKPKPSTALFGPRLSTRVDNKPETSSIISKQKQSSSNEEIDKLSEVAVEPKDADLKEESSEEEDDDAPKESSSKKKKNHQRQRQQKVNKEINYEYDNSDPKYSTWVPPKDQRGDGRTSLNEKLGY